MNYPFPKTWWIDPGKILGGCYPGTLDPHESLARLQSLISMGVRVIINLQQPNEHGAGGNPFADYTRNLHAIASALGKIGRAHV